MTHTPRNLLQIFLDYGIEWEEAWTNHVENWKPPAKEGDFGSYIPTKILNAEFAADRNEKLLTMEEEKENPYPESVTMACIYWEKDWEGDWTELMPQYNIDNWKDFSDEDILKVFGQSGSEFSAEELNNFAEFWPCKIFKKNDDGKTAVVRIFQAPRSSGTSWSQKGAPRFLTDYPLSSIKFLQRPYKSDQFLPDAFRHHIGVPDDFYPEKWLNRKSGDK